MKTKGFDKEVIFQSIMWEFFINLGALYKKIIDSLLNTLVFPKTKWLLKYISVKRFQAHVKAVIFVRALKKISPPLRF